VRRVYLWLKKLDGFVDGIGRGPIGHAVAALSYVTSPDHQNESEMVWPLIGLEALYGRGKDGLERQILEKSELFLGPRTEFKSKFRSIYETRSRFVHGDVDLPLAHRHLDPDEVGGSFSRDSGEVTSLAASILLASLQKLALEGRTDLEFRFEQKHHAPSSCE
jgi:hypothetical protein